MSEVGYDVEALNDKANEHAQRIGQIAFSWNALQQILQALFAYTMTGDGNHLPSYVVWQAVGSDAIQRKMLVAAARSKLGADSNTLSAICWLCKKCEALAPYRNVFVHTPMMFSTMQGQEKVIPNFLAISRSHLARFEMVASNNLFDTLVDDIQALNRFGANLTNNFFFSRNDDITRPEIQITQKITQAMLDDFVGPIP